MVELAVHAGVALGEHGDAYLVLLDKLDAFQDGLQGLPVIFPVDHLAQKPVHNLSDQGYAGIFPLGNKGKLAVGEGLQQHRGVQVAQVVAHQQEPAGLWEFFRPGNMQAHG